MSTLYGREGGWAGTPPRGQPLGPARPAAGTHGSVPRRSAQDMPCINFGDCERPHAELQGRRADRGG